MFSGKWARVWGSIAVFVIVAVVNLVALFGALRIGLVFYKLPAEAATKLTAAALPSSELEVQTITLQLNSSTTSYLNSSSLPTAATDHEYSSHPVDEFYPVCVLLSIGDDKNLPDPKALPYPLLYRLFDAAKADLSKVLKLKTQLATNELDDLEQEELADNSTHNSLTNDHTVNNDLLVPAKLLVGVDYPSVACKMARDSLQDDRTEFRGVEITCDTHSNLTKKAVGASGNVKGWKVGCGTAIVGKSARYTTQLTLEWAQLIRWENLRVIDLDKPDLSRGPPALPRDLWRPTVATTFSSNHFTVGCLLLRSLGKAGMEAAAAGQYNISIVVFALEEFNSTLKGLLDCLVRELNDNYKVPVEVRQFDFSAYPSWMRINQTRGYGGRGEYAWKVIMLHSVLVERGFILWADAGGRYGVDGLVESLNYTRDNGFASKVTSGSVPQFVHPGEIKYFRYQVRYGATRVRNCDGSGVGLTLDKYESIGRPWYDCAMTRQCIAPDGSSRLNHRQDQAALTLVADMSGSACTGISLRVKRHMDYRPHDYSGTYPTECYKDPLQVDE